MYLLKYKYPGPVTQSCFKQKVFLKFSQNSLESNSVGVLNITGLRLVIKQEAPTQVFLCKFFDFFWTPPVAAFETFYLHVLIMKHK